MKKLHHRLGAITTPSASGYTAGETHLTNDLSTITRSGTGGTAIVRR